MKYLKIHTLARGQWNDKDTILLHAAFQILVDFIEQEKPAEIVDWQHDVESDRLAICRLSPILILFSVFDLVPKGVRQ